LNYTLAQVHTNPNWEALAIPPSSPLVRVEGCAESSFVVAGSTWPANVIWHCETAQNYQRSYRIATIVNSDFIDFLFDGQGDCYRIWVDGIASGYFAKEPDNVGNFDEYRIAFNDGKPHRLEIESDGDFIGLIPADGVSGLQAPDWPMGPEVAWFSNSFGEPTITGNFIGYEGFINTASDLIGWNNVSNFSEGGTDYIEYVPGRANYLGHMAGSDGCSRPFDAYVFAGGLNDNHYTMAEEQTAAVNTYQAALACSPKAIVLVFGPIPSSAQGYNSSLQSIDSGIQAAVAQMSATGAPVYYLASPGALGWFPQHPAGCSGSPSDPVYCTLSGDGTHPTQYWHQVLGSLFAPYIQSQAPGLTTVLTPEPLPPTTLSQQQHRRPEVAGEWTITTGSTLVTGVDGDALSSLLPGDPIYVSSLGPAVTFSIQTILDNNTIVLTEPISSKSNSGVPSEIELATYPFPVMGQVPDAAIEVPGTFTYTAAQAGGVAEAVSMASVLNVGAYSITALFTPTDTTDYASATASATVTVNQAMPAITWATPVGTTYGTALGAAQLNASSVIAGTFSYSPAAGTVLGVGTHTVTATFTPTDATDYSGASASVTIVVGQGTPAITWATPAAITYGTALGAGQLNASSTVAGTLMYSPAAGTMLGGGTHTVVGTLWPTDTTDYSIATASVTVTVTQATPADVMVSSANPAFVSNPVSFTATVGSTAGTPTGTVSFYDGTTLLGSGILSAGTGTFSSSALMAGAHSITAVYSGDSNFVTVTSGVLTEAIENFTVAPPTGGTTATAQPGGQATYTLDVAPANGTTFAGPITFSVTGLPAGATAAFTPATIPAGAEATNVTLTVTLPNTTAVVPVGKPLGGEMLPVALGLILLPIAGRLRRGSRRLRGTAWLILLAGAVALAGLTSCGGSGGGGGGGSTPQPQNYTLTITATSGSLSNTTAVTLTVE
jgi:hypothetical protein